MIGTLTHILPPEVQGGIYSFFSYKQYPELENYKQNLLADKVRYPAPPAGHKKFKGDNCVDTADLHAIRDI